MGIVITLDLAKQLCDNEITKSELSMQTKKDIAREAFRAKNNGLVGTVLKWLGKDLYSEAEIDELLDSPWKWEWRDYGECDGVYGAVFIMYNHIREIRDFALEIQDFENIPGSMVTIDGRHKWALYALRKMRPVASSAKIG